jgi:thioesterase domain-containing protein
MVASVTPTWSTLWGPIRCSGHKIGSSPRGTAVTGSRRLIRPYPGTIVCMTPAELETYLHKHIPMSGAMQVTVVDLQPDHVILSAPLAPNINHRETVFGGSAAAVATLAAWSLVHTRLTSAGIPSRLVIQRNTMSFKKPITGTFVAQSSISHPEKWELFTRTLKQKGTARVTVTCELVFAGRPAGYFEGDFVALRPEAHA